MRTRLKWQVTSCASLLLLLFAAGTQNCIVAGAAVPSPPFPATMKLGVGNRYWDEGRVARA
jgi:hypothetical protein